MSERVDQGNSPENWWQFNRHCRALARQFSNHLLILQMDIEANKQVTPSFFTGFIVMYRDVLFWFTAGHVVDKIRKIMNEPSFTIKSMQWIDMAPIAGAEAVIVHNRENLLKYSYAIYNEGDSSTVDFGIIAITGFDKSNLLLNPNFAPVSEAVLFDRNNKEPDGYVVVGYPEELAGYSNKGGYFEAEIRCLPVQKLFQSPNHIWTDPNNFYGQLLPFLDTIEDQPDSIVGMSGGPVFSIKLHSNNGKGRLIYHLVAIQSRWIQSERQICAEPFPRFITILDSLLNDIDSN